MIKNAVLGLVAVAAVGASAPAMAVAITGEVRMAGEVSTDTGSLGNASTLNFVQAVVLSGDGTYNAVPLGTPVTFTNFTFKPALAPTPVNPLWKFSSGGIDYSFVMDSLVVSTQTKSKLNMTGMGTLYATGYDPTLGIWAFSAQSAGGSSEAKFSFSADSEPVPEPGTLALLGLGLIGLGVARRRRG